MLILHEYGHIYVRAMLLGRSLSVMKVVHVCESETGLAAQEATNGGDNKTVSTKEERSRNPKGKMNIDWEAARYVSEMACNHLIDLCDDRAAKPAAEVLKISAESFAVALQAFESSLYFPVQEVEK